MDDLRQKCNELLLNQPGTEWDGDWDKLSKELATILLAKAEDKSEAFLAGSWILVSGNDPWGSPSGMSWA